MTIQHMLPAPSYKAFNKPLKIYHQNIVLVTNRSSHGLTNLKTGTGSTSFASKITRCFW